MFVGVICIDILIALQGIIHDCSLRLLGHMRDVLGKSCFSSAEFRTERKTKGLSVCFWEAS